MITFCDALDPRVAGKVTQARVRWSTPGIALIVSGVVACFTLPDGLLGGRLTPDSTEHVAIAHSWVHGAGFVDPVQWYYLLPRSVPLPGLASRAPVVSILAALPLSLGATLTTVMVLHTLWAALVGGLVFLVGSLTMRRRAAAAAALLLCVSPSWIILSRTPLTEVSGTAAYVAILACAAGVLRSPGRALLCAVVTLLALLTRPQLAGLAIAVVAAALWELGPRRALRSRPLWAYALGTAGGLAALRLAVQWATGEALYAGYGHQSQVLSFEHAWSYGHAYHGTLSFVSRHAAEIVRVMGDRCVGLADAMFTKPLFNHVGWLALPAVVFGLVRPRDGVLAHRINAFAILGYSAVIIATYAAFDPRRYPLLVALPACLGGAALLDAGAQRLEAWLRGRVGRSLARLLGWLPLAAVLALFVAGPAPDNLSRLPVAWARYQLDRVAPAPLKPQNAALLELCRAMHPDAIVASIDPWVLLATCGNAGLRLPIDLHDPKRPELLGRFLAERHPSYFLVDPAFPPRWLRQLEERGFRQVGSADGSRLLEVANPPHESRPVWRAPPPLHCAGRPPECAARAGR